MASTIPGPAREFLRTVTHALDTAVSGNDAAAYDSATAQLATQPIGGSVLGDVLRSLLEDTHPDGLNSDDITLLIGRCLSRGYDLAAARAGRRNRPRPACRQSTYPAGPASYCRQPERPRRSSSRPRDRAQANQPSFGAQPQRVHGQDRKRVRVPQPEPRQRHMIRAQPTGQHPQRHILPASPLDHPRRAQPTAVGVEQPRRPASPGRTPAGHAHRPDRRHGTATGPAGRPRRSRTTPDDPPAANPAYPAATRTPAHDSRRMKLNPTAKYSSHKAPDHAATPVPLYETGPGMSRPFHRTRRTPLGFQRCQVDGDSARGRGRVTCTDDTSAPAGCSARQARRRTPSHILRPSGALWRRR